jgi:hypothetical protein
VTSCQRRLKIPHFAGRKFPPPRAPERFRKPLTASPLSLIYGPPPERPAAVKGARVLRGAADP